MKPLWLVSAAVLAAFLSVRRRTLEPTLLVGGLIAAVGALLYGLGAFEIPNLEKLLEDLGRTLGPWTYLLVGGLAFLETGAFIGLIAPGETTILIGGVVAGQGEIDIVALIALVWVSAVAGDLTSFHLGRRLGREFLETHGAKVSVTPERLVKVGRGCGARRSASWATCSGRASGRSWTTRRRGRWRSAARSWWWPGSSRSCASRGSRQPTRRPRVG